jgi:hypothetical protein
MAATPRPTPGIRTNREHPIVTRHGLCPPHPATPAFRPMPQRTSIAKRRAEKPDLYRTDRPIHRPSDEKSASPRSRRPYGHLGATITTSTQNQKSP